MRLSHHYASDLPTGFSHPVHLPPAPAPHLLVLNEPLALDLGLDPSWLRSPEGINFLTQGTRPDGLPPVAMAYAGHQFGHFVPSLGDGRAVLVGELQNQHGTLFDIHLKGSGLTPFSRGGDGKCALGAALREYIVSEAMHALHIPTSRSLAVLTTGEMIERDTLVPGAIVVRAAQSHIRVGTFQYFAAQGDTQSVKHLADFTIKRLYPTIDLGSPQRYRHLLREVTHRHAALMSQWLGVGFIHGVMNTDNCTLSGETLDYGPCAFLDTYDPMKAFSYVDQNKRYAYGRQPHMALWNLSRLAECFLPLLHSNDDIAVGYAHDILHEFDQTFHHHWINTFRQKLGLVQEDDNDVQLLAHLLETMHKGEADFTRTFRALSHEDVVLHDDYRRVRDCVPHNKGYIDLCRTELLHRLEKETRSRKDRLTAMKQANPRVIPRNHRIEHAINSALQGDRAPFSHLHHALMDPYAERNDIFEEAPYANEVVKHTFCGT